MGAARRLENIQAYVTDELARIKATSTGEGHEVGMEMALEEIAHLLREGICDVCGMDEDYHKLSCPHGGSDRVQGPLDMLLLKYAPRDEDTQ